jgi:hypothetical protein
MLPTICGIPYVPNQKGCRPSDVICLHQLHIFKVRLKRKGNGLGVLITFTIINKHNERLGWTPVDVGDNHFNNTQIIKVIPLHKPFYGIGRDEIQNQGEWINVLNKGRWTNLKNKHPIPPFKLVIKHHSKFWHLKKEPTLN